MNYLGVTKLLRQRKVFTVRNLTSKLQGCVKMNVNSQLNDESDFFLFLSI